MPKCDILPVYDVFCSSSACLLFRRALLFVIWNYLPPVAVMLFRILLLIFSLFIFRESFALEAVAIDEHFVSVNLGKSVEVLPEGVIHSNPLQIRELKTWKNNYLNEIYLNNIDHYSWVRYRITNQAGQNEQIYMELGNNFLDSVDVFLIEQVRKKIETSWSFTSLDGIWSKPFPAPHYVVPLSLRSGATYDVYIRIKNAHSTYIPIRIYDRKAFVFKDTVSKIFIGLLLGVILLASIFSFMMYGLIREKRFFSYGCFSLTLLCLILFLSGYVNLFTVLPKEIDLHRIYFFVSGLFYIALIISFSEMFIHLDIVRKLSRHRVLFLLYPLIIMGSCWFIPYKISIHANLVFIVLCIATSFYILQNKWGKISSFQRVYGITLLVFLVCWLGNSLSRFGILYLPFLSDDVLFYFAIIASFALSFGLVHRTYVEKQSRIYAGNVHKHHSKRFMDMYHQATEGFFSMDLDGKLLDANRAFFNMLGYENIDDFRISCGPKIDGIYADPETSGELLSNLILANQDDGVKREIKLKKRDGTQFDSLISLHLFERSEDVKSNHAVEGIILDVSENRQIKSQIEYLMNHDVVTDLHNRSFMQKRVEILSESNTTYKQNCHDYFLFVDIDHFKVINNSCGSIAGDSFLQIVGKTLRNVVADDNVARLGGDEFGIVVTNCYVDDAIAKAEEIRTLLQKIRFEWNKNYYSITASIGVIPCESVDTSAIMSLAETACGAAKLQGRNRVYLYSELSDDVLNYKKEIGWVAQIYKAIEQNKFILFKQRILTFVHDEHMSYEVFVRLLGDNGNILPASTFIGAAKKFGLISHIDAWVIESLHSWLGTQNIDELESVFINMSLSSISSLHTHRRLRRLFDKSPYPLDKLCFEISENSMRDNSANVRDFVKLIRSFNCKLALDHFECGIGSFALIEQLKPEYLKIDCETLIGLERLGGESVIREIHKELKKYNLKIVIMHIKTDEMYQTVKKYNFDAYQGFGIERPLPISLNTTRD